MRINILETTASTRAMTKRNVTQKPKVFVTTTTTNTRRCYICKQEHFTFRCSQLLAIPVEERIKFIDEKGLCTNCLFPHKVQECRSRFSCRTCSSRHHSVLHPPEQIHNIIVDNSEPEIVLEPEELQVIEMQEAIIAHVKERCANVQLATAIFRIEHENKSIFARALIDQGATTNLVSQRICEALKLPKTNIGVPILGVCDSISYNVKQKTTLVLKPSKMESPFALKIPTLVVPKITSVHVLSIKNDWVHLQNIEAADPNWEKGGRIDILLGAAAHGEIILDGLIKGTTGQPIAQKTELGWIISGGNGGQKHVASIFMLKIINEDLSENLQKFWESEGIPNKRIFTPNEQRTEDIFVKTTTRGADGRFMVKLPFKNDIPSLDESKKIAKGRYASMTKRLAAKPELRAIYDQSIQEYLELGHMEEADEFKWPHNYLPHHPVIKESSSTTKVRAVYDASCKTSNGNSLNSQLLVGPTIQSDLFTILLHWRKGKYAITGDIEKMYRQIWLDPEHTEFQRILWQAPGTSQVKSYRLKTVTFGVASVPFLAIRTLFSIAKDIEGTEPEMANKIKYQFYVDDFFDSVNTIGEAREMITFMSTALAKYGFLLRKWKANDKSILDHLSDEEIDSSPSNVSKTLGVQWHPTTDNFMFISTELKNVERWTKRAIL